MTWGFCCGVNDNYTLLGFYTPQNGSLLLMLQDFLDSLTHADWINKLSHNASNKLPFYAMQNPRKMQMSPTINWLQTTQHHMAFTHMCEVYIVYITERRTEIKILKNDMQRSVSYLKEGKWCSKEQENWTRKLKSTRQVACKHKTTIYEVNIHKRTNVMQLGSMFICNCNIAVTNKHTAKLHQVGSFIYINLWCMETQT